MTTGDTKKEKRKKSKVIPVIIRSVQSNQATASSHEIIVDRV